MKKLNLKKIRIVIFSLVIVSLFGLFINKPLKAECTSYFRICNTCVSSPNIKVKAFTCPICAVLEVSCQAKYGPRR